MSEKKESRNPYRNINAPSIMFLSLIMHNKEAQSEKIQEQLELGDEDYSEFLYGTLELNSDLVEKMAKIAGTTQEFWMNWNKMHEDHLSSLSDVPLMKTELDALKAKIENALNCSDFYLNKKCDKGQLKEGIKDIQKLLKSNEHATVSLRITF